MNKFERELELEGQIAGASNLDELINILGGHPGPIPGSSDGQTGERAVEIINSLISAGN